MVIELESLYRPVLLVKARKPNFWQRLMGYEPRTFKYEGNHSVKKEAALSKLNQITNDLLPKYEIFSSYIECVHVSQETIENILSEQSVCHPIK